MNILLLKRFVNGWHGTLTLCKRLAIQMQETDGLTPFLFKFQQSELIKNILPEEQIISFKRLKQKEGIPEIDIIFCLTNEDLFAGYYLKNKYYPNAKILIGVYHPRQFLHETRIFKNYISNFNEVVAKNIPEENIIFMDDACRESTSKYYGRSFSTSPIVQIPSGLKESFNPNRRYNRSKIISVGRLVDFKRYAFHVIEAVAALNKEGASLHYHVVGGGSLMEELKLHIVKYNAENFVTLYGEMQYGTYNHIVEDAFLFIGMGTSLIEAAGKGIPALVAIESDDKGQTYGAFHTLPDNTIGDIVDALPKFSYQQAIESLIKTTDDEYSVISLASFNKTKFYSIDHVVELLRNAFENAELNHTINISRWKIFKFLFAKIQSRYFMKKEFRHK